MNINQLASELLKISEEIGSEAAPHIAHHLSSHAPHLFHEIIDSSFVSDSVDSIEDLISDIIDLFHKSIFSQFKVVNARN